MNPEQPKIWSMIEVLSNYASGFLVAWLVTPLVMALFGFEVNSTKAGGITIIFTFISIIRSYIWRRLFNFIHKRKSNG